MEKWKAEERFPLFHGHGFELATLNATNLVMRKEDMLLPVSALTAAR